jgi:UDP-GlcNAc:undecaprenyl-phosphate/decaprenyl-phosphate GlcNAc-1-phosphate transferase
LFATLFLFFIFSVLLSLTLTWCVRNLARARGWLDPPGLNRHIHAIALPRLGGVAIFASFTIVVIVEVLFSRRLGLSFPLPVKSVLILLGPSLIIFLLGLFDDVRGVGAYEKFGIQTVAATLLYLGGFGIHHFDLVSTGHDLGFIFGLPLTILWVLLITNALNLIDGLDGLAAGSAIFSTIVLLILSLVVPNPTVTILALALAGATLGFLPFNFYPASIFLGDSGSLFIGFVLSALALAASQKAPTIVTVAIPLVSLGLPILDVALAVGRRILAAKPIFMGDSHHIHHKLLKRGLSQREAVLLLYAITAGFGFLSLILLHGRTTIALVLAVIGIGIFFGVQQLRYQEFAELRSALQRVSHRRHILASHVALRHATESLNDCNEFRSICQVLQDTLQPMGFDGIRLRMLNPNGFSSLSFIPLHFEPDGNLLYLWSGCEPGEPPWELRLALVTSSHSRWGYLTLIRLSDSRELPLNFDGLTEEFRTCLSNAFDRACARMEASRQADVDDRHNRSHKLAAGSMGD